MKQGTMPEMTEDMSSYEKARLLTGKDTPRDTAERAALLGGPVSGISSVFSEKAFTALSVYDQWRMRTYYFMEDANSSWGAMFVHVFIMGCIIGSTISFCLETVPSLEDEVHLWYVLETVFVVVFSVEYVVRFWARQTTAWKFFWAPMNMIDFLAVFPYYCQLVFPMLDLRFLRALRLVRMFKFGRYSHELQLIGASSAHAVGAMFLLAFMLGIALVVFGTIIWFLERGDWDAKQACYVRHDGACSPFNSIPESFWWGITTMTTVGYGDTYPITMWGRLAGGVTMVVGLLCVALPSAILGQQFTDAYAELKSEFVISRMKEEQAKQIEASGESKSARATAMKDMLTLLEKLDAYHDELRDKIVPAIRADMSTLLRDKGATEGLEATVGKSTDVLANQFLTQMTAFNDFVTDTVNGVKDKASSAEA